MQTPEPHRPAELQLPHMTAQELARVDSELRTLISENTENPELWEDMTCALQLFHEVERVRRGSFVLERAVKQYEDLRRGRLYFGRTGGTGVGAVDSSITLLFNAIERAADSARIRGTPQTTQVVQDTRDAVIPLVQRAPPPPVSPPPPESAPETSRDRLIREVALLSQDRSVFMASVGPEIAGARNSNTGFTSYVGEKYPPALRGEAAGSSIQQSFHPDIRSLLRNADVNAAVTIEPLVTRTPVYAPVPPKPRGMAGWFASTPEPRQTGETVTPVPMSETTGDARDTEPAFRLNIIITGTEGNEYRDVTTNRTGCYLQAALVLPERIAKKALAAIDRDPAAALKILEQADPQLFGEQRAFMPTVKRMLVLRPEHRDQALVRNQRQIVESIDSRFIRDVR